MPNGGRDRPAPPAQRSRRVWLVVLVAGAAITAGATLAAVLAAGGSPARSTISDVPAMPAAYQIVYRVDQSGGGVTRESWEVFTQTDPFGASDVTYQSDPRNGASPVTGTVSSFDHLYDLAHGQLTLVSARQPGPGSGIQALGVELAELKSRGLTQVVGRAVVAGESCTVFRLGEPPVGPISAPNGSGHDDMCIDRSGLVLREAWTYQGRLVLQRTALQRRVGTADPTLTGPPPESSARDTHVPPVLRLVEPGAQSFLADPPLPAGFAAPPTVATVAYSPSDPTRVTDTSMIWSFVSGGKLISVEAGQGMLPWAPAGSPTQAVALAGLGAATSALRSDGPEIRVELSASRWVRVRGTVPPEVLARYASELTLAGR